LLLLVGRLLLLIRMLGNVNRLQQYDPEVAPVLSGSFGPHVAAGLPVDIEDW
jgi:hypothetical protein